ncbi:hypothetical protein [Paraburkholderia unamae]|uniref:Uncharacterized protein n=1 Tax=Paraburkholderia unamae TaxID=219649 RepID=A0ABX5KLT3_9BURK|nr:hypothetical protein [Paraburkholderia unamae]PVX77862.1 hypothetical protein C7402_11491 [Paraburkholderia unamae]CAG9256597.1 membrane hypothetical protein [Paraburkholderia unamae]
MVNFICFLLWNLALLVAVRVGCWLIHCTRPDLTLHGTRVFVVLMAIALVFDTAITFLVFADAGGAWKAHNPSETWPERALAYALAALLALLAARRARRVESRKARSTRTAPEGALEIETSPYSKSTLPM